MSNVQLSFKPFLCTVNKTVYFSGSCFLQKSGLSFLDSVFGKAKLQAALHKLYTRFYNNIIRTYIIYLSIYLSIYLAIYQ